MRLSSDEHPPGSRDAAAGRNAPGPLVLFVAGVHRSGTTVLTSALTEALGGVTTTVGVLARHIPSLGAFLAERGGAIDRDVDALKITAETAEEYGFLLFRRTGHYAVYDSRKGKGVQVLREHIAELAGSAPGAPVVLKNPHEASRELLLLRDFPDARFVLLRRRVPDIADSVERSWHRLPGKGEYGRALGGSSDLGDRVLEDMLNSRWRMAAMRRLIRLNLSYVAWRLARQAAKLPPQQVAFLSYEELRADPRRAATWAGHLVDPERLAAAFESQVFEQQSPRADAGGWLVRRADARWQRAWERARAAQVAAGLQIGPAATTPTATTATAATPADSRSA